MTSDDYFVAGESDSWVLGAWWASARLFVQITVPGDREWSGKCQGLLDGNATVCNKDSLGIGKYSSFGINMLQNADVRISG